MKYKYKPGDCVKVPRLGIQPVHAPMIVSIPTITNGQFSLVEKELLKFNRGKDYSYAWADDVKPVLKRGQ